MRHFNGIDILRVLACCLVLLAHSNECYYISNFYASGGVDTIDIPAWQDEAVWAGILGTLCRSSVPLFVMISGFLLLPMKQGMTMTQFYKRRMMRVIIPLAIWTVVYAFYTAFKFGESTWTAGDYALNIFNSLWWFFINYPLPIGHLWYVYMLIGLYLIIPVISPWVERASKKDMQIFLGIWLVSMLLPNLHLVWPEMWGECYWNPNSTVYYFSGFIGYLMAGAYARKYLFGTAKQYTAYALLLIVIGYASTIGGFLYQLYNLTPTADNYTNYFQQFEITWYFTNLPVGIMTLGVFLLLFKVNVKSLPSLVSDFSRLSYGVYLAHIMFLTAFYEHVFVSLSWPTPCKILSICISTIITTYLLIKALSYLPKSKWIVG